MSQKLINLSPDLKRLRDEGYEIEVKNGHLLLHSVPYVSAQKEIKFGTLISTLTLCGDKTVKPDNHVIYFQGEFPCSEKGAPIEAIRHASGKKVLAPDVEADHSFSNKPSAGYENYFAKMEQYVKIISHPAMALESTVTPRTYTPIKTMNEESVFNYIDTASSRAGIQVLSERLKTQRIAIVGSGGTGAYVLDFVAKTPVCEIHLFDADDFLSHNAFRCPGAASFDELSQGMKKVDYLAAMYSKMRKGIIVHKKMISQKSVKELNGFDYVFMCVDDGRCKKHIFDALSNTSSTVIDVGMDVHLVGQELLGTCRVTTCTKSKSDHIATRISMGEAVAGGEYASNIQIAELNALNASLAVIKWKQLSGFYQDLEHEHHLTYSTNCALLDTDEKDDGNQAA